MTLAYFYNMKKCTKCNETKALTEFSPHKFGTLGVRAKCKKCYNIWARQYYWADARRSWVITCLSNHRRKNKYSIQLSYKELLDFVCNVDTCSFCNVSLLWEKKDGNKVLNDRSPTLDRIDNENIITKDNIQIICFRCNRTKGNRTMDEFVKYCQNIVNQYDCAEDYYLDSVGVNTCV